MKDKINFLFLTVDGGGNIPPVFGLAKRLQSRGHEVNVLTEPCLQAVVESFGFGFISFKQHFTRENRNEDICQDWNDSPLKKPTVFKNIIFGPAKITVQETVEALKQTKADVLVVDCLLFPALIAGECLNIPGVLLFHMPEYLPGKNRPPGVMGLIPGKGTLGKIRDRLLGKIFSKVFNSHLSQINAIRQDLGLNKLDDLISMIHQADLRMIQTLKSFDFPLYPAPKNVLYSGPILDDPDWVDQWNSPFPKNNKERLVVVSFSTTFQNQAGIVKRCIQALAELPVRGLVTIGWAIDLHDIRVPEKIKVIRSAPHSRVFPEANLVITHGGHGTIMRALANGLPLIVIPMGRDQHDNAAKIAYHGCGIRLSTKSDKGTIQRAIKQMLSTNTYTEKARAFQAEIGAAASSGMGIRELEQLAKPFHQRSAKASQLSNVPGSG
ncbi:MAG: glycosyltransferase [Cyclobacterium sp.]|uniref:glycosyltransferase n=1 Tax=Cyclobacterium sp. TaxID=1966343 RepID=UPI003970F1D4